MRLDSGAAEESDSVRLNGQHERMQVAVNRSLEMRADELGVSRSSSKPLIRLM